MIRWEPPPSDQSLMLFLFTTTRVGLRRRYHLCSFMSTRASGYLLRLAGLATDAVSMVKRCSIKSSRMLPHCHYGTRTWGEEGPLWRQVRASVRMGRSTVGPSRVAVLNFEGNARISCFRCSERCLCLQLLSNQTWRSSLRLYATSRNT